MIAAIFDVDGTLCANKMGPGIIKYATSRDKHLARLAYFWALFPKYISKRLGRISTQEYQTSVANALSFFLKGKDIQEGADLFEWVARHYLLPSKRENVLQRLNEHQKHGDLVMIVSGAFRPVVYEIAQEFGVNDFIATEVEAQQGFFTGCIIPPEVSGSVKVDKTLEYISSRSIDVFWASSYAYSDSLIDEPLFNMVGHPVAVHPDKKLKAEAKKRNWEIIER